MKLQSRIISKIVAPALQLWLRSQVEQVKDLQVTVEAGDRQMLAGQIRRVSVSAQQAAYQGLRLSQIHLVGSNIHLNLAQVLRGQPLQLLEAIPVEVELLLQAADLNASLQAPILATAISDFLRLLLEAGGLTEATSAVQLHPQQISIDPGQFTLGAKLVPVQGSPISLTLRAGLQLESVHVLRLDQPRWSFSHGELPLKDLDGFKLDLGSEVAIQALSLQADQLICRGQIVVLPAF